MCWRAASYLSYIMDCGGCHTTGALAGKPDPASYLGGSDIGFEIPGLGIFYPSNLTPDRETGLGSWSIEDVIRAVTKGVRPDGRELAPIMPWRAYGPITREDAVALATYLGSIPAVAHKAPGPVGSRDSARAPFLAVVVPE